MTDDQSETLRKRARLVRALLVSAVMLEMGAKHYSFVCDYGTPEGQAKANRSLAKELTGGES